MPHVLLVATVTFRGNQVAVLQAHSTHRTQLVILHPAQCIACFLCMGHGLLSGLLALLLLFMLCYNLRLHSLDAHPAMTLHEAHIRCYSH